MYLTVSQSSDAHLEPQLSPWKVHLGADCGRGLSGTQDAAQKVSARPGASVGPVRAPLPAGPPSRAPSPLPPWGKLPLLPLLLGQLWPRPAGAGPRSLGPSSGWRGASRLCPSWGTRPFHGGLSLPLPRSLLSSEGPDAGLAASGHGRGPSYHLLRQEDDRCSFVTITEDFLGEEVRCAI